MMKRFTLPVFAAMVALYHFAFAHTAQDSLPPARKEKLSTF